MKKCFTLIEFLVYILIFNIFLLIVSSFFLLNSKINTKNKAFVETINNVRRAMEIMVFEIRGAKSVYLPTSIFGTSSGQISLESERYLPPDETSSFLDFFLCEKKICLKKENQPPFSLTSENVEINNLEFVLIAPTSTYPIVEITIWANHKNPKNRPELNTPIILKSAVSLRPY